MYWIPVWFSDEMKDWQKGVHSFVAFLSIINFLLKVSFQVAILNLCGLDRGYDYAGNVAERQHPETDEARRRSQQSMKQRAKIMRINFLFAGLLPPVSTH